MTQGFYEQLGIDPAASTDEVRGAYTRVLSQIVKRRKALLERGGDAGSLDLARSQADEAFAVLSVPARRRRYDAMRALQHSGWTTNADELWNRVAGALVPPAAAAAAELLRVATNLSVGVLPPVPFVGAPPRRSASDADAEVTLTATTVPRGGRAGPVADARIGRPGPLPVPLRGEATTTDLPSDPGEASKPRVVALPTPKPALRVVDGTPSAPSVLVMPTRDAPTAPSAPRREVGPSASPRELAAPELARLVDAHGYCGALLREVRAKTGMSLQEMADTTRISARYLEAIEGDEYERLPSATFVRGYVREMARLLGLDDEKVTAGYMRRFSQ